MNPREDIIALYRQLLREVEGGACDFTEVREILDKYDIKLNGDYAVQEEIE